MGHAAAAKNKNFTVILGENVTPELMEARERQANTTTATHDPPSCVIPDTTMSEMYICSLQYQQHSLQQVQL